MNESLGRLQEWFRANCNGDWEHQYGVRLSTLDNPGWALDVDLSGTPLVDKEMVLIAVQRDADNWLHCKVEDAVFKGRGGTSNLAEMLECFLAWSAR